MLSIICGEWNFCMTLGNFQARKSASKCQTKLTPKTAMASLCLSSPLMLSPTMTKKKTKRYKNRSELTRAISLPLVL